LAKSEFFNKNKNLLFQVQDYAHLLIDDDADDNSTEKKRNPIKITDECELIDTEDLCTDNMPQVEPNTIHLSELTEMTIDEIIQNFGSDKSHTTTIKSSSSCSSRTSHTSESSEENSKETSSKNNDETQKDETDSNEGSYETIEDDQEETEEQENEHQDQDEESEEEESEEEESEEETLYAHISKFPIQLIAMEQCEDTFDNLILNDELKNEEWLSAFMQIIMILITYQKAYSFTHNDLHTNNIMYNSTDKKYLYYCYKKKYYRVPTFGKIFKIIDFGRSIYKFNNILFCSDSFQPGGDAATQYNTEPYMNMNKPRLDPNYSFDLCRLACSIFDYLIDDMDDIKELCETNPYIKIVVEWCLDDKGVNVLYKNNGCERYPDFKLYKMIARHVHNHTPNLQLERKEFSSYEINKNKVKDSENVMNIDDICNIQTKM